MDVVDKIYSQHREDPDQGMIQSNGNAYLKEHFPELSSIRRVTLKNDGEVHDPDDLMREAHLDHDEHRDRHPEL